MDFKTSFCWWSNLSNFRSECEPIMFEARSENECGKWHFWVWNRVWIWSTRQHTPTKISQKHPPPPTRAWSGTQDLRKGARYVYRINSCQQSILHLPYFKFVNSPALAFYKCLSVIIFQSFEETLIYSLVISFVKYYKLSFLRCRWKGYGSTNEH